MTGGVGSDGIVEATGAGGGRSRIGALLTRLFRDGAWNGIPSQFGAGRLA